VIYLDRRGVDLGSDPLHLLNFWFAARLAAALHCKYILFIVGLSVVRYLGSKSRSLFSRKFSYLLSNYTFTSGELTSGNKARTYYYYFRPNYRYFRPSYHYFRSRTGAPSAPEPQIYAAPPIKSIDLQPMHRGASRSLQIGAGPNRSLKRSGFAPSWA